MKQRTLQKWHGAGNDFLIEVGSAADTTWWSVDRVASVCDRHRGIGSDGVIIAALDGDDITMVLFNSDGSRAEMSGNGVRCLVAAVQRSTRDERTVRAVHTDAGVREVSVQVDDLDGYGKVDMGPVTLATPLDGSLGVASVGNPHVIVRDRPEWPDHIREALAANWSVQIGGANVEFVTVLASDRIAISIVERGVGWSLACGTGSVAAVAVLHDLGLVGTRVDVENPGGVLTVTLDDAGSTLAGPVHFVADVTWTAP